MSASAPIHPALRALLAGLIDYAGLFPPARLPMADAVAAYARHRVSADAWALGRFIVPASRLDALAAIAHPDHAPGDRWPLSVLVSPDAASDRVTMDAFLGEHHDRFEIEAVELHIDDDPLAAAAVVYFGGLEIFGEIPIAGAATDAGAAALARRLDRLAEHGLFAKVRCGGIEPHLIPAAADLAAFLDAAGTRGLRFKATAGLHHPLRARHALTYADDSPTGVMHGFVNVFLAALWARQRAQGGDGGGDTEALTALLEDGAAEAFVWTGAGDDPALRWRDRLTAPAGDWAALRRELASGYGSCSFDEPLDDLRALGWLPPA